MKWEILKVMRRSALETGCIWRARTSDTTLMCSEQDVKLSTCTDLTFRFMIDPLLGCNSTPYPDAINLRHQNL